MFVVFLIWTICSAQFMMHHTKGSANAVVVMIFLYYVFYNIAWSGLLVGYAVEIMPYNMRAKVTRPQCSTECPRLTDIQGLTIMFLAIDLSLFFNQYINPIALARLTWKYYIFYDAWLLFELFIVWRFYLETRNTPLEEIVKHFDGESAILGGTAATEKSRQLAEEIDRAAPLPIESTGAIELAVLRHDRHTRPRDDDRDNEHESV